MWRRIRFRLEKLWLRKRDFHHKESLGLEDRHKGRQKDSRQSKKWKMVIFTFKKFQKTYQDFHSLANVSKLSVEMRLTLAFWFYWPSVISTARFGTILRCTVEYFWCMYTLCSKRKLGMIYKQENYDKSFFHSGTTKPWPWHCSYPK